MSGRAVAALGALIAALAVYACWFAGSAHAGGPAQFVQTLPGGTGQQDQAAAGPAPGTPWLVTDPNGAPMAWVNLYGLYSGGDGGRMPGGLICVTWGVTASIACLTPAGTLRLQATGVHGPHGPTETLTARDIAELHLFEKAHVTLADLRWLTTRARRNP